MKLIKGVIFSFPFQLLVLHLKKHLLFLCFWALLLLIVTKNFGDFLGIPYLFLDPEYLGEVGYLSFAIVGFGLGGFWITWNLNCYLLSSYRFPFLASLNWPLAMFTLNNSLIPAAFTGYYIYAIVQFQLEDEFQAVSDILLSVAGLLAGIIMVMLLSAIYFQGTNRTISRLLGQKGLKKVGEHLQERGEAKWENLMRENDNWRVDTYITNNFGIRPTRKVEHYDQDLLKKVFKQHHLNALFIQLITIAMLMGLGFLMEFRFFQIPVAASALMFSGVVISLVGIFTFWTGSWAPAAFIVVLLFFNTVTKYDLGVHANHAYGLDYSTKAEYNRENLERLCSDEQVEKDKKHTLQILENWKARVSKGHPYPYKPKLLILTASGGGTRSAYFSAAMLQHLDELTSGAIIQKATLISGASGGLFSLPYFRELMMQELAGESIDYQDSTHLESMGKDLLNPIIAALVTNDLFLPWKKYELDSNTYFKDRGYMFEKAYNRHTGGFLNQPIHEYRDLETQAAIPMLISCATVTNDMRMMFISPQPVSYLMRALPDDKDRYPVEIDGIDFGAFFKEQKGYNLRLSSAIRMNGTYPFVLPNVELPSEPVIQVIDAGARDNFGTLVATRFTSTFRDWIDKNTSGVVLVQLRDMKFEELKSASQKTLLEEMFNPLGTILGNVSEEQDYNQDYSIDFLAKLLKVPFDLVTFEYIPDEDEQTVSMTLHLTTREKNIIRSAVMNEHNERSAIRLKSLLSEE